VELSGIGNRLDGLGPTLHGEFGDVDFLPAWKGGNPVKTWRANSTSALRWN